MKSKSALLLAMMATFLFGCNKNVVNTDPAQPATARSVLNSNLSTLGLRNYFQNYFPIGVACGNKNIDSADQAALIGHEFNSLTPDNAMKWRYIHPEKNTYSWAKTDALVAFAQQHNMKVRGHVLVWHHPDVNPTWVTRDSSGQLLSKTVFLQQMRDHIFAVMTRYKGKIYAYDVVNEAVSDDPATQGALVKTYSDMYKIAGLDYIYKAFEYAHEADPDALLFYNDNRFEDPSKRDRIYTLLSQMKAAGVPLQGIGMQAHWWSNQPTRGQLQNTIVRFNGLGLKIQITELDNSVYPNENTDGKTADDYDTQWNAEKDSIQCSQYKMYFETFIKYKDKISSVTFWNVSDRYTWRTNYPVYNRTDYPLLFDASLQPKNAYWSVVGLVD
ncbi:MAG: endo-1,4-beta-xylanase [Niabella sp.]